MLLIITLLIHILELMAGSGAINVQLYVQNHCFLIYFKQVDQ